jgi:hypothetical protein
MPANDFGEIVDQLVNKMLTTRFKHVSRRSFLSKLTRLAFGAAGVTVAARAALELRPAAAQVPPPPPNAPWASGGWQGCGLNGFLCGTGSCTPPANLVGGGSWSKCCFDPSCGFWFSCTYNDMCGTVARTWNGSDCSGQGILYGATNWCTGTTLPDGTLSQKYWCTVVACSGGGSPTEKECNGNALGGGSICDMREFCRDSNTKQPCNCYFDPTANGWKCTSGNPAEINPNF